MLHIAKHHFESVNTANVYNKQPIKLKSIVLPVAIHCQLNKYDVGLPIANSARISFNHYLRHPAQLP
jgi:hypothetical protein